MQSDTPSIIKRKKNLASAFLKREVRIDVFLPQNYLNFGVLPTLLLNDGQDTNQLGLLDTLSTFNKTHSNKPIIVVAVWANENRLYEYGTKDFSDYKKRGNLANEYQNFVLSELIPLIKSNYPMAFNEAMTYAAGFSLGGLAAFDIAWENPQLFKKVGVFSGSFWWRSKAYEEGYEDKDRIMHNKISITKAFNSEQEFWLQCGTNDEESDRNGNGIIDSIDDTLDLIEELEKKGFQKNKNIEYIEIKEGQHNFNTWKNIFPEFLKWLFKNEVLS